MVLPCLRLRDGTMLGSSCGTGLQEGGAGYCPSLQLSAVTGGGRGAAGLLLSPRFTRFSGGCEPCFPACLGGRTGLDWGLCGLVQSQLRVLRSCRVRLSCWESSTVT